MPLNDEQKRTIEKSIDHLLDFPADPSDFVKDEKLLTDAFTQPESPDNEFCWLKKCLENPAVYFQNISKMGPAVTQGEVQEYLIEYITLCLNRTGNPCLLWNPDTLLAPLRASPSWSSHFVAEKSVVDNFEHPYELQGLDGRIYDGMIGMDIILDFEISDDDNSGDDEDDDADETTISEYLRFYVTASIRLAPGETHTAKIFFGDAIPRHEFQSDEDETLYIETLKPTAKAVAENYAARCALQKLSDLRLVTRDIAEQQGAAEFNRGFQADDEQDSDDAGINHHLVFHDMAVSQPVSEIITHVYYFEELCKGNISFTDVLQVSGSAAHHFTQSPVIALLKTRFGGLQFSDLLKLSNRALHNLSQPAVYELLSRNLCSLNIAFGLNDAELSIVTHPVYYAMLTNQRIHFLDVCRVTDENFKLLILPLVANLIQTGALQFLDACKLPIHFKPVLMCSMYERYFTAKSVPWPAFSQITEDLSRWMLNGKTARGVTNGSLPITDILNFSSETIRTLEAHPRFLDWVDSGLIECRELHPLDGYTFYRLYCKAFIKRLYLAACGHPAQINGQADSLQTVLDDLSGAAADCCVTAETFKQSLLLRYAVYMKFELNRLQHELEDQPLLNKPLDALLSHLSVITDNPRFDEDDDWTEHVACALNLADQIQKTLATVKFLDNKDVPASHSNVLSLFHVNVPADTSRNHCQLLNQCCERIRVMDILTVKKSSPVLKQMNF
ncbi:hypothetical protein AQUSIP_01790 [Aquicella siphonis]|uniref:Uncharacterized protein n=1 Tax=Aquicella siphonis TaxID=254247 RepID=A0A5E4PE84_9COXI|nr:hypothetical protein [Aquicella siphonis]VVC74905.1 hypothetical protein AQUSIP_01790 [Aquicella siphonis]